TVSQSPSNAHAYRLCIFNDPADSAAFTVFVCLLSCDQLSLVVYISFCCAVKKSDFLFDLFALLSLRLPLSPLAFRWMAAVFSGALQYMPDFGLSSNVLKKVLKKLGAVRLGTPAHERDAPCMSMRLLALLQYRQASSALLGWQG
ncbi:hypothetical protein, partial [Hydrogenophaga sp.]|uniref:hypothetical protein n=1 Tax=Hydrogenophaga sp. TaxID=1904254 RepID=UPI00271FE529